MNRYRTKTIVWDFEEALATQINKEVGRDEKLVQILTILDNPASLNKVSILVIDTNRLGE
jgi:hypothetical protein